MSQKTMMIEVPRGYEALGRVFAAALNHAAKGKGDQRHGVDGGGRVVAFEQQNMIEGARAFGPGGPLFQVQKKAREGCAMFVRGDVTGFRAEILGAINYAAGAVAVWSDDA